MPKKIYPEIRISRFFPWVFVAHCYLDAALQLALPLWGRPVLISYLDFLCRLQLYWMDEIGLSAQRVLPIQPYWIHFINNTRSRRIVNLKENRIFCILPFSIFHVAHFEVRRPCSGHSLWNTIGWFFDGIEIIIKCIDVHIWAQAVGTVRWVVWGNLCEAAITKSPILNEIVFPIC